MRMAISAWAFRANKQSHCYPRVTAHRVRVHISTIA